MDSKTIILNGAKEAIKNGKGNYYALPNTTWLDILNGYESGNRLDNTWEAKLINNITLLLNGGK